MALPFASHHFQHTARPPARPPDHAQVRANLHVVLTASPVGENFRIRSQRFLATITSTVCDWFHPW